jgi:hypothetical protein
MQVDRPRVLVNALQIGRGHPMHIIGVIRDRTLHRIPSSFPMHIKAGCDWMVPSFSNHNVGKKV